MTSRDAPRLTWNRRLRPFLAAFLLAVGLLAGSAVSDSSTGNAQASCTFTLGFRSLRDQIPSAVGACLENEWFKQDDGNALQRTSGGLLVWRKADNWTAFTNGSTTWLNGPCGLQSRANGGPFYNWEGRPGSACIAGSTSAALTEATRPAPATFAHPVIDAPTANALLACLASNPSCGREPWWMEWNDDQRGDWVQYRFLGPGLTTQYRFIEAIWLLWQWPEGRFLLNQAAQHGIRIQTEPFAIAALASYRPADRIIRVNSRFAETSTWMVADIVAHELKHAADDRAGMHGGRSTQDCIAREQSAYQTESRFLKWVAQRFGGLPSRSTVLSSRLSDEDKLLFINLLHIETSSNVDATALEDYRKACSG